MHTSETRFPSFKASKTFSSGGKLNSCATLYLGLGQQNMVPCTTSFVCSKGRT